ncbi:hypothetical protein ACVW0J_001109 [Bradyrhizobium sp. i1.7.7]
MTQAEIETELLALRSELNEQATRAKSREIEWRRLGLVAKGSSVLASLNRPGVHHFESDDLENPLQWQFSRPARYDEYIYDLTCRSPDANRPGFAQVAATGYRTILTGRVVGGLGSK